MRRGHFSRSKNTLGGRRYASLLALCTSLVSCAFCAAASLQKPNIVVISSDDAGYNDFGFMAALNGMPTDIRTPNLDSLAAQSTVMRMGYSSGAVCSPSRAGLLTGQYQQRFGHEDNPNALTEGLEPGQKLITHYLKDLGYSTGMVGKWHLGYQEGVSRPLDVGFDEFYGTFGGGRPYWGLGATDAGRTMRRGNDNIESEWVHEGDASRYDPVRGRYMTDAFGEEAVDFINRHADDAKPFFLYVPMQAPHTPFDAKQSDMNQFSNIADIGRRAIAAMTYSLDRAVGDITSALAANGLDDNTIVVFLNDNGGPAPSVGDYENGPLRGNKGSIFEGGIRVPYLIKVPGLAPSIYDRPVISLDLLPTLVNAAGGNASQIDTNGADLMPFLEGEQGGDPHGYMFWRGPDGRYAVRKGDWKLVRPPNSSFSRLHNTALDITETAYYNADHPELVTEMQREMTNWEVTLHKAKWGALGSSKNRFDHFVYRNNLAAAGIWSTANSWTQGGTNNIVTFTDEDAYANAIVEFQVRNDADYTTTNDIWRMQNRTFMLNELRLTGQFAGAANHTANINGNPLLFVNNLDGGAAKIRLDATSSNPSRQFTFRVENELQLYHDLEITGDGTQNLVISGAIRDFYEPRRVIKSGASSLTLTGANTFLGPLVINGGRVSATSLPGRVELNGGTFSPGNSPALTSVSGFEQHNGTLEIELGGMGRGTQYDVLQVNGDMNVGGTLRLSLIQNFMPSAGQTFDIFDWTGSLGGTFTDVQLPLLTGGLTWDTRQLYDSGLLRILASPSPGDFNRDGSVNSADYVLWRKRADSVGSNITYADWLNSYGTSLQNSGEHGDYNHDGTVDTADYVLWRKTVAYTPSQESYDVWRSQFGQTDASGNLAGDFNHDGTVDMADYIAWRKGPVDTTYEAWRQHFGEVSVNADLNRDGFVNSADYVLWRKKQDMAATLPLDYQQWFAHYGQALGGSGGSALDVQGGVPEPASLIMILTAAIVMTTAAARRRR